MTQQTKNVYERPQLKVIGSVADLTHTGLSGGSGDLKSGSTGSQGV